MKEDLFPGTVPLPRSGPQAWRVPLSASLGLAVLVLLLFWPATGYRLLSLDDRTYVSSNPLVERGLDWDRIVHMVTTIPEHEYYVPVTYLSFMADVEIFGMSPAGFHFTNVLLHAVNSGLLLLLLWRMTGSLGKSAVAAALVAVHPFRVESVAWVSERKDLLAVFFLILGTACHVRFVRERKGAWYAALLLCSTLGILSKPVLVTIPGLLLLVDFWPLGRFATGRETVAPVPARSILVPLIEKVPLAALSVLAALACLVTQRTSLHTGISLGARLSHAVSANIIYLIHSLWPRELAVRFFPTTWEWASSLGAPLAAGAATVTFLAWRHSDRMPSLAFGWSWFVVALFPVGGILSTGSQWTSDRFTYIPHIGLAIAIVWLADSAMPRRIPSAKWLVSAVTVLTLGFLSRCQLPYWRDAPTLLGRTVALTPNDPMARGKYAEALAASGDASAAMQQFEMALSLARPPIASIHRNYALFLIGAGDRNRAVEHLRAALEIRPDESQMRLLLADLLFADGRLPESLGEYRELLRTEGLPGWRKAAGLEGLGLALSRTGRSEDALAAFQEGVEIAPRKLSLRYNLALMLAQGGRPEEAIAQYRETLRISPLFLRSRVNLAELLFSTGRTGEAVAQFEEIERIVPGKAEAYFARGRVLEAAGVREEAGRYYRAALQAPPALPETPAVMDDMLETKATLPQVSPVTRRRPTPGFE